MLSKPYDLKADLLEKVIRLVRERVTAHERPLAEPFVAQYYAQVDLEDLLERTVSDLCGAALAHWQFARQRTPGDAAARSRGPLGDATEEASRSARDPASPAPAAGSHLPRAGTAPPFAGAAQVRVYNPRPEKHGWQCRHTVVEIVHPDMPFLVDSVRMEVNRQGLAVHLIVHPVMRVRRDPEGVLMEVLPADGEEAGDAAAWSRGPLGDATEEASKSARDPASPAPATGSHLPRAGTAPPFAGAYESFIHMEVDRRSDSGTLERLREGLERVLEDVREAVEDWRKMVERMGETVAEISRNSPPLPAEELAEGRAFLEWAMDHHFTFLGCRDYALAAEGGEDALRIVPGSGLGILREKGREAMSVSFSALPAEVRERAREPALLILTKSNSRATVHRPAYLDYIGVKRFDAEGKVVGERRFLGLYTSTAYSASVFTIPVVRAKCRNVLRRASLLPASHLGKALVTILETYPRDELFQIAEDDLFAIALGILHLEERSRTRLFVRRDAYGRFLSCLVYVPREVYTTELRQRMQAVLMEAFNGVSSEFFVNLSESVLARVLFVVRTRPGAVPEFDVRRLETKLAAIARRWQDDLAAALTERYGEERGSYLFERYGEAFPIAYRAEHSALSAVGDIELMEGLASSDSMGMHLYRLPGAEAGEMRFKLLCPGGPVPLSVSLPLLERMGVKVLDERPYRVEPRGGNPIWIHDLGLSYGGESPIDEVREIFQEAFLRVWRREAESDDFNRLVLSARLTWREVALLRGYAKHLRQAGLPFSQSYIEQALAGNPGIARRLVELFRLRFDPDLSRDPEAAQRLAAEIEAALDAVVSLDEDRILHRFLGAVQATTRTNFFQRDAQRAEKLYFSFKFDPALLPGLPEPKPMFEIFVYSPRVEGVHLRGGKVARGGIRWSDRLEDFRTEVLGLMKAQKVKNAVIVPVGAKGGFVVKQPPASGGRDAWLKEGIECYRIFIQGLLDLTDNLVGNKVVPPAQVVRYDGDDPYLVVAADKGTAAFSDIANSIAREYGFWLGDAFASGGSTGYDHKKMGITARGAWESAKKHFRALGVNIEESDFTVVGIGDMSGDVFGNGMLLSRHIKLIAAFDHRHIFLDPDPDPELSYGERQRLFQLPSSSWADYDPRLISEGGGVYPRSAKAIVLSPEAKRALAVEAERLTPSELICAILKAPVDLLYNGGIGTFVKASHESHAEVGDRGNDAIRVNARDLRCRVVVEGGNLGFTQPARIEYALKGGRIHTDAIDNSGGVDCSDHEVNIKILLDLAVSAGDLTENERNQLLVEMGDEVARLVLRDNYFQAQSLGVAGALSLRLLDAQARFIRFLERSGKLNRELEHLPSEEELSARRKAGIGLTSPERSVLLAYSKIWLFEELLASNIPEDPFISLALERYFPEPLRERFRPYMERHPLKREIIATYVVNSMVNRVGSTFVHQLWEETGAKPSEVVRAYLIAREVFGLVPLWQEVEALDNRVMDEVQNAMLIEAGRLLVRGTLWFLCRRCLGEIPAIIARFRPAVEGLSAGIEGLLGEAELASLRKAEERLRASNVPPALALRVASLDSLYSALDILEVAQATQRPVQEVAALYFALAARLNISWLRERIRGLPTDSHWQVLARSALRDELAGALRSLTAVVLKHTPGLTEPGPLIDAWQEHNRDALERTRQVFSDLRSAATPDLAMLSVALRELKGLA